MEYLVRSASLTGLDSVARQHRLNPQQLLQQVRLTPAVLRDPDLYISYLCVSRVLEYGARISGDDAYGLQLARHQGSHTLGSLGLWLLQKSSVLAFYRQCKKNLSFHVRGAEFDLLDRFDLLGRDEQSFFNFDVKLDSTQSHTQLIAMSVGLINQINCSVLGEQWRPTEVWFKAPAAEQQTTYEAFFHCPVRFNQSLNGILFPAKLLSLPIGKSDNDSDAFDERYFSGQKIALTEDLELAVGNTIASLLPTGECSLAAVAACFDLHPRVLQNRLMEMNTSFNQLLADKRYAIARQNLALSNISIMELALNLGYAETAVFTRAFRKWSGESPRAWRNRNEKNKPVINGAPS